MKTPKLSSS